MKPQRLLNLVAVQLQRIISKPCSIFYKRHKKLFKTKTTHHPSNGFGPNSSTAPIQLLWNTAKFKQNITGPPEVTRPCMRNAIYLRLGVPTSSNHTEERKPDFTHFPFHCTSRSNTLPALQKKISQEKKSFLQHNDFAARNSANPN